MPTTRLIRFIESHGNPCFANADGTLTVTSIECRDGVAREVQETIPATMAAARNLLGY
ncbi:hypothetical protein RA280_24610 [Cupriavidus sp. CV2]|uniref:hypothetical protein n=1 Tax=Cupriavidus ulmosensis TaxID=3065913 RepID=UPI00296B0106|nr:hypothetical protein [Cupriavidus sp. CV2]MDW3684876.1 hypothetical protein [Cupriavidus sp. CV2]